MAATDFGPILEMLSAITGLDEGPSLGDGPGLDRGSGLPHRYIGLILAGLRPDQELLPGSPPTEERLRHVAKTKH